MSLHLSPTVNGPSAQGLAFGPEEGGGGRGEGRKNEGEKGWRGGKRRNSTEHSGIKVVNERTVHRAILYGLCLAESSIHGL